MTVGLTITSTSYHSWCSMLEFSLSWLQLLPRWTHERHREPLQCSHEHTILLLYISDNLTSLSVLCQTHRTPKHAPAMHHPLLQLQFLWFCHLGLPVTKARDFAALGLHPTAFPSQLARRQIRNGAARIPIGSLDKVDIGTASSGFTPCATMPALCIIVYNNSK